MTEKTTGFDLSFFYNIKPRGICEMRFAREICAEAHVKYASRVKFARWASCGGNPSDFSIQFKF